jgi:hypothetical protein
MPLVVLLILAGTLPICLWSLLCAFLLRLAVRVVEKRANPFPYVVAFATCLALNLVNYAVACVGLGLAAASESDAATFAASIGAASAGFLIQANGLANRLELAFGKACVGFSTEGVRGRPTGGRPVPSPLSVAVDALDARACTARGANCFVRHGGATWCCGLIPTGRTREGRCACCSSTTRSPCGA